MKIEKIKMINVINDHCAEINGTIIETAKNEKGALIVPYNERDRHKLLCLSPYSRTEWGFYEGKCWESVRLPIYIDFML